MTIRTATARDVDAILDLWAANRSPATTTEDTVEVVERLMARDPEALLVADLDGEIVATVVAAWDGWRGAFYRLAVVERLRRHGIATRLVEAGELSLHRRGCRRISVLAGAEETGALEFWCACGYGHDTQIARLSKNIG